MVQFKHSGAKCGKVNLGETNIIKHHNLYGTYLAVDSNDPIGTDRAETKVARNYGNNQAPERSSSNQHWKEDVLPASA